MLKKTLLIAAATMTMATSATIAQAAAPTLTPAATGGTYNASYGAGTSTGTWTKTPGDPRPYPMGRPERLTVSGKLTVNGGCAYVYLTNPADKLDTEAGWVICGHGSVAVSFSATASSNTAPVGVRDIQVCRATPPDNPLGEDCGPKKRLNNSGKSAAVSESTATPTAAAKPAELPWKGTYGVSYGAANSNGNWHRARLMGEYIFAEGPLKVSSDCYYLAAFNVHSSDGDYSEIQCGAGETPARVFAGASGAANITIELAICRMVDGTFPDGKNCGTRKEIGS